MIEVAKERIPMQEAMSDAGGDDAPIEFQIVVLGLQDEDASHEECNEIKSKFNG